MKSTSNSFGLIFRFYGKSGSHLRWAVGPWETKVEARYSYQLKSESRKRSESSGEKKIGDNVLSFETGLGKQASTLSFLVTVIPPCLPRSRRDRPTRIDFSPDCDYRELPQQVSSPAGHRREGRPSTKQRTSRLIDRPIRHYSPRLLR